MAIWKQPVLTEQAKKILTEDLFEQQEIVFTRIEYGCGQYGEAEDLSQRTALREKKQEFPISSAKIIEGHVCLRAVATNTGLKEPYEIWEVGIYARLKGGAGKEILFSIAAAEKADTFPSDSGGKPCEILQEYYIYVVEDLRVSVEGAGAYVTVKDFEEYQENIQKQFEDLPVVKIGKSSELNRKDMILMETISGTEKIYRVLETDSAGEKTIHEFASVFQVPEVREKLESGDDLGTLFGKIARYFADVKPNVFQEADDPFVLMTESTYIQPQKRMKGSLYGLITKERNVLMMFLYRYVQGLEDPRKELTMYGVETKEPTLKEAEKSDGAAKAVLYNFEQLPETGDVKQRQQYTIYGKVTLAKGE